MITWNRRQILSRALVGIGSFVAFTLLKRETFDLDIFDSSRPYEVILTCLISHNEGLSHYEGSRSQFQSVAHIDAVNRDFLQSGRLLLHEHQKAEKTITWKYVFRSKSDYKDWNRIVYHGGLFSRKKMPVEFDMQITERFV